MATNVNKTGFTVQVVENDDGTLAALTIQKTLRVSRVADNGRVLDAGMVSDVGDAMQVPAHYLADLVRELVDWPMYYACGAAAQEAAGL